MSNCCTPLYIKVPLVSPTGDIKLRRGTGNAPSCGYYENYTGDPELNNYDYHIVDIQYNSGSGFWTFSGNSTGFNDPSIYRSIETGNPCNPVGTYTGGLFGSIIIYNDPFGFYPIYEFEPAFENDTTNVAFIGKGSGIHLERDVTFDFSFVDKRGVYIKTPKQMVESPYFDGVSYDIINKNGSTVKRNYLSGYLSKFTVNENDNIKIFGTYEPNFGIRARTLDKSIGQENISEIYTYGNKLYIPEVQIQDNNGSTKYYDTKTGAYTTGASPSGKVQDFVIIKNTFANTIKHTRPSHLDVYASTDSGFKPNDSNKIATKNLTSFQEVGNIEINKSFGLDVNTDYWFALVGNSKIGSGNAVKFGPHQIFEFEDVPIQTDTNEINIQYKGSNVNNSFKTGLINAEITGSSGIVDKLQVGNLSVVYSGAKFLYKNIPTDESGKWRYTSFDYSFEFKDPSDPYRNIAKNIKINATGTSYAPLNSGMPLFQLTDLNTGVAVELGINYVESGFYLVANTGHDYKSFKYQRTAF